MFFYGHICPTGKTNQKQLNQENIYIYTKLFTITLFI